LKKIQDAPKEKKMARREGAAPAPSDGDISYEIERKKNASNRKLPSEKGLLPYQAGAYPSGRAFFETGERGESRHIFEKEGGERDGEKKSVILF